MEVLKLGFWAIVLAACFLLPMLGEGVWRRGGRLVSAMARRPALCWIGAGILVLLVRAALLPLWPIPQPYIYDEFGYLLQADTFASGRLTNPAHPLWPFFESVYILQQPTYNAKYPPGQGLAMALGQRLFGHPWFGVWLSCGALMMALCWAYQGWLPPRAALLGAWLSIPICLFSYWMGSYWGGAVAAIGGALVLGGYARVARRGRWAYAWAIGAGLVLLTFTRMYEGLLFAIPILVALLLRRRMFRVWLPVAAVLLAGLAFQLLYNERVTGHAMRLPYTEYQSQYGYVPSFNFQPLAPLVQIRNESVFNVFHDWEFLHWSRSRHLVTLFPDRLSDWSVFMSTAGRGFPWFLLLMATAPYTIRDRRMRLAWLCIGAVFLGTFVEIVSYPHYVAPMLAAFFLVLVQSLRHLSHWKFRGAPVGRSLARVLPLGALLIVGGSEAARIYRQETPEQTQPVNARRSKLEDRLRAEHTGRDLIIVRYTGHQSPHEEWVYNRADIDASPVVWAHDLGAEENRKLITYYKGRTAWSFDPDADPERLVPYGAP